jgi:hypothetical protein
MNISIAKYRIVFGSEEVYIEATKFDEKNQAVSWAVRTTGGLAMSKEGNFSYEPMPSNRDDEFLKHYRFSSPKEAISAWYKYHVGGDTPQNITDKF